MLQYDSFPLLITLYSCLCAFIFLLIHVLYLYLLFYHSFFTLIVEFKNNLFFLNKIVIYDDLSKTRLLCIYLAALGYTFVLFVCLSSCILFLMLFLLTFSFILFSVSSIGFYIQYNALFSNLFVQLLIRSFLFILTCDFILVDLCLDGDFEQICNLGRNPKFAQLRPSTFDPTIPLFLKTCSQHNMMLVVPTDHYVRDQNSENFRFDSLVVPHFFKIYHKFEIPTTEDEALFLTLPRKQGHVFSTYSGITQTCMDSMGSVSITADYTQDPYFWKTGEVIDRSDIREVMAWHSLTLAHSNTEVLSVLAYLHQEYPGEKVSLTPGGRYLDFIVRSGNKEFGLDICSTRPLGQNFIKTAFYKTSNLATLQGKNKVLFCNFNEEYMPSIRKLPPEVQKLVTCVEPEGIQNLFSYSGLDIDNARNIALSTPKNYDPGLFFTNENKRIIIKSSIGFDYLNKLK